MSLTYTQYINSIVNLMPVPSSSDPGFQGMVSNMIDDAEQRLYRELDLVDTIHFDDSAVCNPSFGNIFILPTTNGTPVVVTEFNVYSPAGTFNNVNVVVPASTQMINSLFDYAGIPQYFANIGNGTLLLGPAPDQAYTVETWATYRPAPLSVSNATTLLSVFLPDLFVAASMIFASAYMKNFGAAVDDPKMGVTWQSHYDQLLMSAHTEEQRKKFTSQGWSPNEPTSLATPPRT